MQASPIRVIHVDDDPGLLELTGEFLEREDDRLVLETATSADEGLDQIGDCPPDCIVSDYDMPGKNGIEFLQAVRETHPDLPFILFTGKGSESVASDAIAAGVTDYLQKGSGTEQYELLANRITNAVQAQRATREATRQAELMRLTEFAGDTGGWELDLETEELLLTDGARRLINLSPDDSLGLEEAIDLYHPDDRDEVRAALDQAAETGEQVQGAWRLRPNEGEQRLLDVTVTPVRSNGDITTLRGAVNDITERYERRRKLEQIETLFQYAQDSLFLLNANEEFTTERVNPAHEEVTGWAAEQALGRSLRDLLGERAGAVAENQCRECVERRESLEIERTLQRDGEQTHYVTRIAPVVIDGDVEYIAGSTRDVTEKRDRQRELRLLQQAIDGANVAITLADPSQEDNPLVYVNDAYKELTGYSEEEALGRNCRYLQGEDTDPEKVSALREAIDDEAPVTVELRNYRKDGPEFWNRVTVTPIYDDDGTLVRYLGTQQDVTERKERERELETERRFIEQSLNALNDLFYVLDTDGTLRRWNDRFIDVTGYTESELDGMHVTEVFHEDEQERIADAISQTLADDQMTVEADLETADGDRVPYEWTGARLTDTDGTTTGIVGIGRDLSERRQRERRFRALVEGSNDVISIVDVDGRFQYQSPSLERILGYGPEETVGDLAWEYVHPDDREAVMETFEEWLASPDARGSVEYRARHADGSWRWFEARASKQFDTPAVEGYVINSRDITDGKNREQELQRITNQYQTLIQNFPDGAVFLFDTDNRYVRAGGQELTAVGLSPEEVKGETPYDLFPEGIAEETVRYYQETLAGASHTFEQEYGGEQYRIQTVPIRTSDGEIAYGMAVSRNVTERTERRQELERQKERLEEFASVVSHDLRNPLRVAEGRLELAQTECDSPHLDDVADAIDRSQALIEDLLTLAREGDDVSDIKSVALADVAESSWQTVESQSATLGTHATQVIQADRGRLKQLFENLYRNAIEHGGDDVTVSVGSMDGGFYVADTGPGVPESDREKIFEAGYSTAEEGTGFGLRIVKQVVEAHGWDIRVTDSDDDGARFEITGVDTAE